ncbi:MAG: hypothetical protein SV686_08275 [Thermodesulfobacteriota bacterium]|nr:hypothetical protein [Thermodesulfobacteriota bacterium]
MKPVYVLMVVGLIAFTSCSKEQKRSFTELPVYPEAINAQYFNDHVAKGVASLTYKVKIPFPASETINFIEHNVTAKDFIRYNISFMALPGFKWSNFNPKSGEWEETNKIPARYSTSWVSESKNEIIWIVVDYSSANETEDWQNTAHVSIQIASFSQFKKEMEAIRQIDVYQPGPVDALPKRSSWLSTILACSSFVGLPTAPMIQSVSDK